MGSRLSHQADGAETALASPPSPSSVIVIARERRARRNTYK